MLYICSKTFLFHMKWCFSLRLDNNRASAFIFAKWPIVFACDMFYSKVTTFFISDFFVEDIHSFVPDSTFYSIKDQRELR